MEFGLCCLFYKELIKFKTYTYAGIKKLPKQEAWEKVIGIWKHLDIEAKAKETAIKKINGAN